MASTKRILVALATVIVAAECFIPFLKRESELFSPYHHEPGCEDEVASCIAPVQQNPLVISGSRNYSILLSHVDEICQLIENTENCIRPSINKCNRGDQLRIETSFSVGDFLCSTRGRALLREVQNSVCVTQPLFLYGLQAAIQDCIVESVQRGETEYINVCQQFRLARSCSIQTVAQECGEAAGDLVSEVLDRLAPVFPGPHCHEEGSDEYLKRGLDQLIKRYIK